MLTVEQVLAIIVQKVGPITPRRSPLVVGGVLAEVVRMDEDSPRFDRATLDGYALRSADGAAGSELEVVGHVNAGGEAFSGEVGAGRCVAINTGAVMPAGADAVLMVEHAERVPYPDRWFVTVKKEVKAGFGVQKRGSDAQAGEVVLEPGTRLGPAQMGVCAAAGVAMPLVRRARVAVLSTGDELVDVTAWPSSPSPTGVAAKTEPTRASAPLPVGKIRNSNRVMLCALAAEAGAEVVDLGTCRDEEAVMREVLRRGMGAADLLVVCGGMSMGTRDLVPVLLKELGVQMHVEKVAIKPGKPFVLGTVEVEGVRKYVAGLPGNPVSAFVTFQRFVRAMLWRMEGSAEAPRLVRAYVDRGLDDNGDREFYGPCVLRAEAGKMAAAVLSWRGSADMFTLARANGLIIQTAGAKGVAAGAEVEVMTW